jgi:hypothetical protein
MPPAEVKSLLIPVFPSPVNNYSELFGKLFGKKLLIPLIRFAKSVAAPTERAGQKFAKKLARALPRRAWGMETSGIEPPTYWLQTNRSPN